MTLPSLSAEASLYRTTERYHSAGISVLGGFDSVAAQQLCRHFGQSCGGIDLFCCPGLRCTAGLGGRGICVPDYHCSPCIDGRQFCCPPPGLGAPCHVRSCIVPY